MKHFLKPSIKISLIYFFISFIWILSSDEILKFFIQDIEAYATAQTYKGWFFITLTSLIIYYMVDKSLKKEKNLRAEIENIFEQSATPIALFDEDGNVLKINSVWEDLTGYKLDEINTLKKWTKKAYGEKAEEVNRLIKAYFDIKKRVHIGEFNIRTKDNKILVWHFDFAPYGKVNGKKVIVTTVVDITELRKKENMLVQQSKMATMGEMIGNIAHQWKQPLSLISMSNALIRLNKELDNLSSKEVEEAIDNIDNSVRNLSHTIDDFRNFFNPNKSITTFRIFDTFTKTFKLIDSQFKNSNIDVIKNIKNVELNNLENELLQALINILKNAKDELVKKSSIDRKLIFIETYEHNDALCIKIKDNAGGIPKNIIGKIFDAYFSTKENTGGTGIGLYMSRQIIEEHMNGKIEVSNVEYNYENENYKGAEFKIIIPINK